MVSTVSWVIIGVLSFLAIGILGFIAFVFFESPSGGNTPSPSPGPSPPGPSPCGQCPGTQKCNPVTKQCVDCLVNQDCGEGRQCLNGNCQSTTSCVTTGCIAPLKCDRSTGNCVGCVTTSDCTGGKVCVPDSETCMSCAPDLNSKCEACQTGSNDPLCNTYPCCLPGNKCSGVSNDPSNVRCCPATDFEKSCGTVWGPCGSTYNPYCVNSLCTCAQGSQGDGCLADTDCESGFECVNSICSVSPQVPQGRGTNESLRNRDIKLNSTLSQQILQGQTSYFPSSRYEKPKKLQGLNRARLYDYQ